MLMLLNLPMVLVRIGFYALCGLADGLRGRRRLRVESTVLINAPREAVWRFVAADRVLFDGPPAMEIVTEPLPDSDDLRITRISVNGQEMARVVSRQLECDEARGTLVGRQMAHELT